VLSWLEDLGPCKHPRCLAWSAIQLEAQWGPTEWHDLEVCVQHVPWAVRELLSRLRGGKPPSDLVARQLHAKGDLP
jgi:hypothetical protein